MIEENEMLLLVLLQLHLKLNFTQYSLWRTGRLTQWPSSSSQRHCGNLGYLQTSVPAEQDATVAVVHKDHWSPWQPLVTIPSLLFFISKQTRFWREGQGIEGRVREGKVLCYINCQKFIAVIVDSERMWEREASSILPWKICQCGHMTRKVEYFGTLLTAQELPSILTNCTPVLIGVILFPCLSNVKGWLLGGIQPLRLSVGGTFLVKSRLISCAVRGIRPGHRLLGSRALITI